MIAAERAGQGWVVWNARNNYKWTWRALELVKKKQDSLIENKPLKWRGYNYGSFNNSLYSIDLP